MKNEKKIETEENGERVVRLAEPVKKGPFRLLFSRFFIVALLLVIQVAVVIGAMSEVIHMLMIFIMQNGFYLQTELDAHHCGRTAGRRRVLFLYAV